MSAKTFSPQFRPHDFQGPLARHYPDREDLFQQLVGAALREVFHQRVAVTSTKGRDGGIDIFIGAGCDSEELFCDLRFPIIVECKDHDDSLSAVTRNVEAGWSKVQAKLAHQAEAGWGGTYQPWRRAKGYLYCVSAVLHQQAREKLTQSIQSFFSSLPPEQRPSTEKVHVLDWSDLAPLLNRHTRLADAWLGTDLGGIVSYEAYEAGLSGFRLYLKEEKLPFVSPMQSDPAHPENLLASLEKGASSSGILIIGPGGVGKTRTCFEVARLADQKGWRVLHLLPGEPPVTASAVQDIVLQGSTPTLLVIDYLDQMGSLDFETLRHRLIPETQARGIPLALLANARPGLLHKADPERDALFHRIDLDIRDRRDRITAHFQETIAPRASRILSPERVRETCGTRPIIGMFIARELERYALEDKLDETVVSRLRHGDLQGWIRRRFEEDGLSPRETHPLLPASPDPIMMATAAGFAAAPLSRPEMALVISRTLVAAGMVEATETATSLIASLESSGWLEENGYELTTPHDVIADELLERTLCDRERRTVRVGITDKVLVGALSLPRVLGRFSVSLDRVIGQQDFPEQTLQKVKESVSAWLDRQAFEMGRVFLTARPGEVSYALGAVLTGVAWGDTALMKWDDLIAPWLALHAQSAEARHLLYRGLKELPERTADSLAVVALRWFGVHSSLLEASYVLSAFFSRQDLGDQMQPAVSAAMTWLGEHGIDSKAGFVLYPLLSRQDLGDQAQAAVKAAMTWLVTHGADLEAGFVLYPLLSRQDLGDQAQAAVKAAMTWLGEHGIDSKAGFVLYSLLSQQDLGDQAQVAVKAAMTWLVIHGADPQAGFVLNSLLSQQDLGDQAQVAVKAAMTWLVIHGADPQAGFVLHSLLSRQDLGDQAQVAVKAAMTWLVIHGADPQAGFVLHSLLSRQDLGDQAQVAVKAAMAWLVIHGADFEAGFVLPPLLSQQDLGDQTRPVVSAALSWLERHGADPQAQFVLHSLLSRQDLGDQAQVAVKAAMTWLATHGTALEAGFVLPPLLSRQDLGDQMQPAINAALTWLETHFLTQDAEFVLKKLLGKSYVSDDEKKRCITLALNRLDKVIETSEASFLLRWCLSDRALSEQERKQAFEYAIKWLRLRAHSNQIDFVFKRLLRNPLLEYERWREVANFAFGWLKRTPLAPDRDHALNSLLACLKNLTSEEKFFLLQDAQAWLNAFPNAKGKERLVRNLERLGITNNSHNPSLSDLLREQAQKGILPGTAQLHQGIETVRNLLDNNHPAAAAYYLSSLLPLAALKNDPTFTDQVIQAVRTLLVDPILTFSQKKGFSGALYRFLDAGAWPDREEGERLLLSLGIHRPSNRQS